jgi:hypothetical protein
MDKGIYLRTFAESQSRRAIAEEVGVTSGVPQRSVLGPLLFLAYVKVICRNTESSIRLFADDCITCRKIMDSSDTDKLQADLN